MSKAWEIRVRGLVQGVGFRPFVWRIANEEKLFGEVLNDAEGVIIRLRASKKKLTQFKKLLKKEMPLLAQIDSLEVRAMNCATSWSDFTILPSQRGKILTGIVPDAATCSDCLADIMDLQNRRYGYAFTNCTNCGPRLSIILSIPYDRENTSMASFKMCAACQSEYEDPLDRRFHAQPNACPDCGPHLKLVDKQGSEVAKDAITATAHAIKQGQIVAIKGLGGFQLAVDAGNCKAVELLRNKKHRPSKPLACMAKDIDMVALYTNLKNQEKQALMSPSAPIILLPISGKSLAAKIAPDQNRLGFMLPNTPLHHLLMQQLEHPIVLTSGNLSDEPQIIDNETAIEKLSEIADFWLTHDRDIINRVDDSVVQIIGDKSNILRRARGYAPAPFLLDKGFANCPSMLGVGADIKNTFCLLKAGQAIVSQHMGDMQNPKTQRDFYSNLALYCRVYDFSPITVVTDLHPGYFSTRLGDEIASKNGAELISVQHHHAHIAAVLGEYGYSPDTPEVLGLVLDGLGYGTNGALWGGEILLANFCDFKRLAHIPAIPLLGGEKASLQPWRNAYAHLISAFGVNALGDLQAKYGDLQFIRELNAKPVSVLDQMLKAGVNVPLASSTGRLFDAVCAILGYCFDEIQFEGQAAMRVQSLAQACPKEKGSYCVPEADLANWQELWQGIFCDIKQKISHDIIAAKFHNTLINVLSAQVEILAIKHEVKTIVLSGGVMQNLIILNGLTKKLQSKGLLVLSPNIFSVNDSAISFGQVLIGAATKLSNSKII